MKHLISILIVFFIFSTQLVNGHELHSLPPGLAHELLHFVYLLAMIIFLMILIRSIISKNKE